MANPFQKRINKEFSACQQNPIPFVKFVSSADNSDVPWLFDLEVKDNYLYTDGPYRLQIIIGSSYPVDSPQVQFIQVRELNTTRNIPIHPHIYSNGHICLDLLGSAWTPVCNIHSILVSIHSLLTNNTRNERPPDDETYSKNAPLNPKKTSFVYHDDTV